MLEPQIVIHFRSRAGERGTGKGQAKGGGVGKGAAVGKGAGVGKGGSRLER